MPDDTQVILTPGMLPPGYCWTTPQQFNEDIINIASASLAQGLTPFNFGPAKPSTSGQSYPWIRTDAFGNFDRVYTFNGVWLSPHPIPASSQFRTIWVGNEADLWAIEDSHSTVNPQSSAPTDTTGSFWQVDHAFDFRIPIGVGTSANTYLPATQPTAITVGQNLGEEKHKLIPDEEARHYHQTPVLVSSVSNLDQAWTSLNGTTAFTPQRVNGIQSTAQPDTAIPNSGYNIGTAPDISKEYAHNTLPPVVGVYFIKRTARIYYTVP